MDPLIPSGLDAPDFQLLDYKGRSYSLREMHGKIVVLNFWSAECTWCERVDNELISRLETWKDQVRVLWIDANANESNELVERVAGERNLPTVLLDQDQRVADLYGAQTTPHFFVIDRVGKLAYQGAWDDITFRQRTATQVYVPQVVEALINNIPPQVSVTPPYGCVLVRAFETT